MIHPNTSDYNNAQTESLRQPSMSDFMSIIQVLNSGYIERDADRQLLNALKSKQFCAVFAPPQSGKSSLSKQVSAQLMADDIVCLTVDLAKATHGGQSSIPDESSDLYGQLILSELWHSITDLPPDHLPFWLSTHPHDTILPQLEQLLGEILLVHCEEKPVVIFVDGLDAHLTHNASVQELLALVLRCHNRRSRDPIYQNLTFCLMGNANLERLMGEQARASFHSLLLCCHSITLQGFTAEQAIGFLPILTDVVADPHLAIRLITHLTGGQPLLTHQLCHLVRTQSLTLVEPEQFDLNTIPDIVRKHMPSASHFQRVRDRLLQTGPLLEECLACYQRLLLEGDRPITDSFVNDGVATELGLVGVMVRDGNWWAIANPIYQDMFDRSWLLTLFNHCRARRFKEDLHPHLASVRLPLLGQR